MTKQEQIEEIKQVLIKTCKRCRSFEEDYMQSKYAETLYNAGYRKIDEFEKCRKCPAWSGTDCTRNPYTEGCLDDKVNLKNEIKRLEKENNELKAKLEARLTCDAVKGFAEREVKKAKIDAFNKLKEKIVERMGDREYMGVKYKQGVFSENEIDEMIAEVKNGEDKS